MPPIFVGSTELTTVGDIKIGGTNVQQVFVGSTQVFPTGGPPVLTPIIDFSPKTGGGLPSGSTFTRADSRYYFDSTIYVLAGVNVARFQTFPAVSRHFLWEPEDTNEVEDSHTFTQWTNNNTTDVDIGQQSIGLITASRIDEGTTPGVDHHIRSQNVTFTAGEQYTQYIIVKDETATNVLARGRPTSSTYAWTNFDMTTGVVNTAGVLVDDAGVIILSDGFRVCWQKWTCTQTNSNQFYIAFTNQTGVPDQNNGSAPAFTGTNRTFIFVHAQLGVNGLCSPIPTTGSPVSVVADSLTDIDWPVESSAVVDVTVTNPLLTSEQMNILGFGSAAGSNFTVNGQQDVAIVNGGINATVVAGSSYVGERHGYGMSLKTNEGIVVDDEDNDDTDLTGTPGQGAIYFGSASDLTGAPCWLHRARIYDEINTVEGLKALVAGDPFP